MDRVIPFLAAFVGLVALGGAVLVQLTSDARTQRLAQEMAELRTAVDALAERTDAVAADIPAPVPVVSNDGTIDALLALQDRMNSLEQGWAESQVAAPAPAAVGDASSAPFSASAGSGPAAIDPSWPTENCIPLGTRFMASTGEELAICQTPVVVKVSAITADNVLVDGTGVINETGSKPIPGSNCSLMVFTAEAEGFAELRVACN
jgi:outer membrane murein-binding lipoprotein Lpp